MPRPRKPFIRLAALVTTITVGWFSSTAWSTDDSWTVTQPSRLLDTRNETILQAGSTTDLRLAGHGNIPANADTVLLNLTTVNASGAGFLTVYPCASPRPTTSNLNYAPGTTQANLVVAPLDGDGRACIYTHATTHLVADLQGYTTEGFGLTEPSRLLDTRSDTIRQAGSTTELRLAGQGNVPADANTVVLNLTTINADAPGFLTVYPCASPRPTTSNLNYAHGTTQANLVIAPLDANGRTCIYTHATTHLVADLQGYMTAAIGPSIGAVPWTTTPPVASPPSVGGAGFVHPGVLVDQGQLDSIRHQVAAGEQPWVGALDRVYRNGGSRTTDRRPTTYGYASLSYVPAPVPVIQAASSGTQGYLDSHGLDNIGDVEHLDDARAAYTHALLWSVTGDQAHADKAIEIMNAWSATLREIKFDQPRRDDNGGILWNNGKLQAGWGGTLFARAGELVRHTGAGWADGDIARFESMLRDVYLPLTISGWTNGANWMMTLAEATISIGVFTNDRAAFDAGIAMWRTKTPTTIYHANDGPAPIPQAAYIDTSAELSASWFNPAGYVTGLGQETLRDLSHMTMGLGAMANAAETAYIQGIDLYGEQAERITAAFELNAGYVNAYLDEVDRLGGNPSSTWTPPNWPGTAGSFNLVNDYYRSGWLVAHHHYTTRVGVSLPQTTRLVERLGSRASQPALHLSWEPLTHS